MSPIGILHLSDLHFKPGDSADALVGPLLEDFKERKPEFIVVSGDLVDRGKPDAFSVAINFLRILQDQTHVPWSQFIFCAGNHDLEEDFDGLFEHRKDKPEDETLVAKPLEIGYWVRVPTRYSDRFKALRTALNQLTGEMLNEHLSRTHFFPQYGLQFLVANTAYRIDKYRRKDADIDRAVFTRLLDQAKKETDDYKEPLLRIAVWHHAVQGRWSMSEPEAWVDRLANNGFALLLHGDVHEPRAQITNPFGKSLYVAGCGTLHAEDGARPPGLGRFYNFLEIARDLRSIRVHVREQDLDNGSFDGYYKFTDDKGQRQPYFTIPLSSSSVAVPLRPRLSAANATPPPDDVTKLPNNGDTLIGRDRELGFLEIPLQNIAPGNTGKTAPMDVGSVAQKRAADVIKDWLNDFREKALQRQIGPVEVSTPDVLAFHLQQINGWSAHVQLYGMASPVDTASDTIALTFDAPRRFRSYVDRDENASEMDLLASHRHILLLGDPGSGKTTTVKRVAQALLTKEAKKGGARLQYPIVVRLRELPTTESLIEFLAEQVGIGRAPLEALVEDHATLKLVRRSIPCQMRLCLFLNHTNAAILLDGLDEVPSESYASCLADIRSLARNLTGSKMIVTCRSGAQGAQLEGFRFMEICPLDIDQIHHIATKWLGRKSDAFLNLLTDLPYRDVASRPLLIAQLMILFKRYGTLPGQPAEVYRKIIRLMLEDWDAQRSIVRHSKYSRFGPDRKAQFLSALAYYLTIKAKSKRFTTSQLVEAYLQIHSGFGLPAEEGEQVVAEVETHTGIIVSSGDSYEFSHLSVQEFLCGEYIVKTPFPELAPLYASEYPAPLAVAVAISSDPSGWLAGLFLKKRALIFSHDSLEHFLSRLEIERPNFTKSPLFALSLMKVLRDYGNPEGVSRVVARLLMSGTAGLESATQVIAHYQVTGVATDRTSATLTQLFQVKNDYGFVTPKTVVIPADVLEAILRSGCEVKCASSKRMAVVHSVAELYGLEW